ncbi:MAG: hypothetical protein IKW45_03715 [Clostridia bacterium]|nr:hypothetical protein [Clostridia bacterium]
MIKKLDAFEVGYRKGVLFALNELLKMSKDTKLIDDKMRVPIKIYLSALIEKLDYFIDYGSSLFFAYSAHDKKKIPQKAEVYKSFAHYKRAKKLELLLSVVQMEKGKQNDKN